MPVKNTGKNWGGSEKTYIGNQIVFVCICTIRVSIVVSIPACHAGDRGSIPRHGDFFVKILIKRPPVFFYWLLSIILWFACLTSFFFGEATFVIKEESLRRYVLVGTFKNFYIISICQSEVRVARCNSKILLFFQKKTTLFWEGRPPMFHFPERAKAQGGSGEGGHQIQGPQGQAEAPWKLDFHLFFSGSQVRTFCLCVVVVLGLSSYNLCE